MSERAEDLADANLLQAIREHARWQQPSEVVEDEGMLMMAGANAFPAAFRNCVARTLPSTPAGRVLERASEFFGRRGRGFTVFVREKRDREIDKLLRSSGLVPVGETPCMVVEAPVAEPRAPQGVRLERFSEERHVRDAAEVSAEAYQAIKLAPEEARVYFCKPEGLLSRRVVGFVAYEDSRPVATALTILSGEGAGVYWVGTRPSAQRRGLGELCTALSTNAGFAAGARVVTLQATAFGAPVYRRLGYRTYDQLYRYRVKPA